MPRIATEPRLWSCPECTASCTFEAMMMCRMKVGCPAVEALGSGQVVDRRPTDRNPSFPSEFTVAAEPYDG